MCALPAPINGLNPVALIRSTYSCYYASVPWISAQTPLRSGQGPARSRTTVAKRYCRCPWCSELKLKSGAIILMKPKSSMLCSHRLYRVERIIICLLLGSNTISILICLLPSQDAVKRLQLLYCSTCDGAAVKCRHVNHIQVSYSSLGGIIWLQAASAMDLH